MRTPLASPSATNLFNLLVDDALSRRSNRIELRFGGSKGLFLSGNEEPLSLTAQVPVEALRLMLGRLKALMGHAPGSPPPLTGVISLDSRTRRADLAVSIRLSDGYEMAAIAVAYPDADATSTAAI